MSTPCAALAWKGDSRSVSPDRWKVLTSSVRLDRHPGAARAPSLPLSLPAPSSPLSGAQAASAVSQARRVAVGERQGSWCQEEGAWPSCCTCCCTHGEGDGAYWRQEAEGERHEERVHQRPVRAAKRVRRRRRRRRQARVRKPHDIPPTGLRAVCVEDAANEPRVGDQLERAKH